MKTLTKENNMKLMVKAVKAAVILYTVLMCLMYSGELRTASDNSPDVCTVGRASYISMVYAKDEPDKGGSDSSGVSELDSAKSKTNGLVVWFCHWIGGVVFIIALIVFLFMAGTHQTEQRNTAAVVMIMAAAVYFSPSIVNYVLGKNVF